MKKILIMMLLAIPFAMTAQPIVPYYPPRQSKIYKFTGYKGDEVIVRSDKNYTTMIHHRDLTYDSRHYYTSFTRLPFFPPQGYSFRHDLYIDDERVNYYIHDMCIYDDTCYVCGEAVVDHGAPYYYSYDIIIPRFYSNGFLAKFAINQDANQECTLQYKIFNELERLNKITVYHPDPERSGFRKMIVATAEQLNLTHPDPSCLIEIKEENDGAWKYSIIKSDLDTKEVYSDVLAKGDNLFVSSYIKSDDSDPNDLAHWFYYIHMSTNLGFSKQYIELSMIEDVIGWDAQCMSESGTGWGWHKGDESFHLNIISYPEYSISYLSTNQNTGSLGLVMVPMNGTASANYPLKLTMVPEPVIKEITYQPSTNEIVPLGCDLFTPLGKAYFSRMGIAGYHETMRSTEDYNLSSVDTLEGKRITVGGYLTNDKTIIVVDQQHNYPDYLVSCLTPDFMGSEILKIPCPEKMNCRWKYIHISYNNINLEWSTDVVQREEATVETICQSDE